MSGNPLNVIGGRYLTRMPGFSHESRTTPITCTEWHNFSSPRGFVKCIGRDLRVPKCDIYGFSAYLVFFSVLVFSRLLMRTPSASPSALDLEGPSITERRLSAAMAITTITHTPVRPTAITARTGLRAAFSSAQVPGLVSGVALASGTVIVSLIEASTVVVALVEASTVAVALITASAVATFTVVVSMAADSAVEVAFTAAAVASMAVAAAFTVVVAGFMAAVVTEEADMVAADATNT